MAIFHCYVSSPEGTLSVFLDQWVNSMGFLGMVETDLKMCQAQVSLQTEKVENGGKSTYSIYFKPPTRSL